MTHVFRAENGAEIIASKGAPEAIIALSNLSPQKKQTVLENLNRLLMNGYRVLGVGQSAVENSKYPQAQHELKINFKGLVAFYDPQKKISPLF